ncbi:MAG: tetratricopeptide repeat protein [Myxococcota bacterium]
MRAPLLVAVVCALMTACAARQSTSSIAPDLDRDENAARLAFGGALARLHARACDAAVEGFDRLVVEFPESRYVSASLYNAGLCLQRMSRWGDAVDRYEHLLALRPGSHDTKHARFQLAFLYIETKRYDDALEVAERLEGQPGLTSDERSEIMARRAEALLGTGAIEDAARAAEDALVFFRTRSDRDRVRDPFFAASASYTYAESIRLRSEAIQVPAAEVEAQHAVLETRAALLLQAQRAYFDTMRYRDAYWASAAGYRIGAMYDRFWDAVIEAPVPPPTRTLSAEERTIYDLQYRRRLAELAQPLVRHAIRYWELTLSMVARTGVDSEWTTRIEADLERVRARLVPLAQRPVAPQRGGAATKQSG